MKKTVLLLILTFAAITLCCQNVFADAIAYDMHEAGYYVYVATPDGGLNIRSGPGVEYERVMDGRIPDGVKLYIGYTSDNWGFTSYNGYDGWVALKQTSKTPPATPKPEPTIAPTPAPQVTETIAPTPEVTEAAPVQEAALEQENVKNAMEGQILLVLALVILIVVISVLIVVYINIKPKK